MHIAPATGVLWKTTVAGREVLILRDFDATFVWFAHAGIVALALLLSTLAGWMTGGLEASALLPAFVIAVALICVGAVPVLFADPAFRRMVIDPAAGSLVMTTRAATGARTVGRAIADIERLEVRWLEPTGRYQELAIRFRQGDRLVLARGERSPKITKARDRLLAFLQVDAPEMVALDIWE